MEVFKIENLTFGYPETGVDVLKNINMTVEQGDFVCICGPSGSGKSTLLKSLKPSLGLKGGKSGKILFCGEDINELSARDDAEKIGFVFQSPDNQIVTDRVWHELAFGLESLGYDNLTIRRRTAEAAELFGLREYFNSGTSELSGGQKQLLNLACISAMQPEVIILDEPTAQLDPIAASEFISRLVKFNRESSTTVIITEHRLEEIIPVSTKLAVLENGELTAFGKPQRVCSELLSKGSEIFYSMPAPIKIWSAVERGGHDCPLTAAEGRSFLFDYAKNHTLSCVSAVNKPPKSNDDVAIRLKDVWFRYERNSPDILRDLSFTAYKGELTAIMGGNGTGKSTALSIIASINKPYRGKVRLCSDKVAALPQDPKALFVKKTLKEDLLDALSDSRVLSKQEERRLADVICLCKLSELLDRHPFDLSGGEQQRAALAKVLLKQPEIILLDEPTKGCDARFKREFAAIIKSLTSAKAAVVIVSHDLEFCAEYADSCVMFFNGQAIAREQTQSFFLSNNFYVTAAARMSKGIIENAVTCNDVIYACTGRENHFKKYDDDNKGDFDVRSVLARNSKHGGKKASVGKKVFGALSLAALLFSVIYNLSYSDYLNSSPLGTAARFLSVLLPISALMLLFGNKSKRFQKSDKIGLKLPPDKKRPPSKRAVLSALIILLLIPLTVFAGMTYLQNQKYLFISLLVMLECSLPFILSFEGRKPRARELAVIAVLCAVAVAGRVAFSFLPQFKPVLAMVIISGAAFGGETGFIVGAVTMLASNMLLGQGTWTPWQMFAAGIIGFLGGVLYKRSRLCRGRGSLCTFGFVCAIVVYGGIMNLYSAVTSYQTMNLEMLLTFYATGFPMDLIHAISTAVFLYFAAEPILEKTDRIKTKYALLSE